MTEPRRTGLGSRVATLAVTGLLGTSLLGGVAYAATSDTGARALNTSGGASSAMDERPGRGDVVANVLKELVAKGAITQTQADAISTALKAAHPAPPAGRPGGHAGEAAETYLGLTAEQIHAQLSAGKSLGELAAATAGKTRAGLVAALVQAQNALIDKAVTDGKLTAAQATERKAQITSQVTEMVDRKGGTGAKPGGDRRGGPGGPRGPRPGQGPTASPPAASN